MPPDGAVQSLQQTICAACGSTDGSEMHHLIMRVHGGNDGPKVLLCGRCHGLVHSVARPNDISSLIYLGQLKKAQSCAVAGYSQILFEHCQQIMEEALAKISRVQGLIPEFSEKIQEAAYWMEVNRHNPMVPIPSEQSDYVFTIKKHWNLRPGD